MITRPPGPTNAAYLLSTLRHEDWRKQAACRTADPRLFDEGVPGETPQEQADRHEQAKAVCAGCPVADPCLKSYVRGVDEGIRASKRLPPILPRPHKARAEIKHGKSGGAQAHRRRGEQPCRECLDAENWAKQKRDREGAKQRKSSIPPAKCGTYAGYKRHQRLHEARCRPCLDARNAYARAERERKKAA